MSKKKERNSSPGFSDLLCGHAAAWWRWASSDAARHSSKTVNRKALGVADELMWAAGTTLRWCWCLFEAEV